MESLNSLGQTLVAFIFVLGVLIFIHELGHYLVAKYLGIRVEVFSLGFGTRLIGFRWGETDYRISLIPLGGYVKMAGENPDEELAGSPEEFLSRPKRHRFAVAIAGPLMNIGLAVLLFAVNFMVGSRIFSYFSEPPVIGAVEAGSPAEEAGLQIGDRIVSIDREKTPTWKDAELKIGANPNTLLELEVERDGEILRRRAVSGATPDLGLGHLGIRPFIPYRVEAVDPGSPAEQAGLQAGDEIVSLEAGGESYSGFWMIKQAVAQGGLQPLLFKVERKGETLEKTIVPVLRDERPQIGAYLRMETQIQVFGFFESFRLAVQENLRMTSLTFSTVGKLLTGRASMKQMSGPIDIARYSGIAASQGAGALLAFMAIVSLQLGILNLLPIPILDGGVIALLAVEGILGRDLSMRVKERIFQVGFIFIVVLMGVVIFNDITKNLPNF